MADKIMDRVAKYLALAENEGATEAEREAAMAQAMKWSQFHNIDMALVRSHNIKKAEASQPERRQHKIVAEGRKKVNGSRLYSRSLAGENAPLMDLFLAIAAVYDLKCIIIGNNTAVDAMGYPEDHEMAERLFSILSVQMVKEADDLLKAGANKTQQLLPKRKRVQIPEAERDWGGYDTKGQQYDLEPGVPAEDRRVVNGWGGRKNWDSYADEQNREHPPPTHRLVTVLDDDGEPVMELKWVATEDARIWRKNHYVGFISKIRQRLVDEKRQAMREAGIDPGRRDDERGLALVDKAKQVAEAHEADIREKYVYTTASGEEKSRLGEYEGTKAQRVDYSAQAKGAESAARAVTGSEKDLGDH